MPFRGSTTPYRAGRLILPALVSPGVQSEDPAVIEVLAVTTDDVVTAVEANERRGAGAVLRVTPPFSGRMRARLHIEGTERGYGDPAPLHVPPERFVESVPPFPHPDDTEDAIREAPGEPYTPERHRERHEAAVERWRELLAERLLDRTTIGTPDGGIEVRIAALG